MFFKICLYISLGIFALGVLYRIWQWSRHGITEADKNISPKNRLLEVSKAIASNIFSRNIVTLSRTFVLDILLVRGLWQQGLYRWATHMLIFWGFIFLLLMHALAAHISEPLLPNYMSSLNPYLFLRDLFALMVLAGIIMAACRRLRKSSSRVDNSKMDWAALALLLLIIISGVFLKGSKIASESEFERMTAAYSDLYYAGQGDEALKGYWVENFGLMSPELGKGETSLETLQEGKEQHEVYCASCHSQSQWAMLSYGSSKLSYPVTNFSSGQNLVSFFWYLHILAVFAGLAWIPFGKMFHALSSPLSLFASAAADKHSNPATTAVRRVMQLDACTRCGACSESCAVGVAVTSMRNKYILPLEKLQAMQIVANGDLPAAAQRAALLEGLVVCTDCKRCTVACPVGIDLQDIWMAVREDKLGKGEVEPYALSQLSLHSILKMDNYKREDDYGPLLASREYMQRKFRESIPSGVLKVRPGRKENSLVQNQEETFSYCFKCMTCTLACPVPGYFKNPKQELGLFPHQIVHATGLGFNDIIASSRMLWACLGCYQCQEECPMGVRVTDLIQAHKQAALIGLKTGEKT